MTRPPASGGTPKRPATTTRVAAKGGAVSSPPDRSGALSIDDVKRLRDRIEGFNASVTPAPTGDAASDGVVALVAEKLRAAGAEDRRRIDDLQAQLTIADKDREAARGRIAELEGKLGEGVKALRECTARVAELEKALAAHRAEASETQDDTDAGLRDALDTADALIGELAKVQAHDAAVAKELEGAKAQLTRAQREVQELRTTQKAQVDGSRVLGPESVAALLDDFVGSFRNRLGGLQVASGEVQLKAAFAALGDRATFVLPAAGAKTADLPVLHEIRLKLDPRV